MKINRQDIAGVCLFVPAITMLVFAYGFLSVGLWHFLHWWAVLIMVMLFVLFIGVWLMITEREYP